MWVLLLLSLCSAREWIKEFESWVQKHSKQYATEEEFSKRLQIFKENMLIVEEHNAKNASWTAAMNKFGDLSQHEFEAFLQKKNGGLDAPEKDENMSIHISNGTLCDSIDWVEKGAVTPVENQGDCGSCYAFAALGSISGQMKIKGHGLRALSVQEVIDCDPLTSGCTSGAVPNVFKYSKAMKGLCAESDYDPYAAKRGKCHDTDCKTRYGSVNDWTYIPPNSTDFQNALCNIGPLAIAVDAGAQMFRWYYQGVMSVTGCGADLDHGVLAVGLGYDSLYDKQYWKIKNSWGSDWGEKGYIRLCRNCGMNGPYGQCGVLKNVYYPVL